MKNGLTMVLAVGFFSIVPNLLATPSVSAYDKLACAEDPLMETPQRISLIKPVDKQVLNCIPGALEASEDWTKQMRKIQNRVRNVGLRNKSYASVTYAYYSPRQNLIVIQGRVIPKQTQRTKELRSCNFSFIFDLTLMRSVPRYGCIFSHSANTHKSLRNILSILAKETPSMGKVIDQADFEYLNHYRLKAVDLFCY